MDTGEWFLPHSDIKLNGRLIFNDENHTIILELYTDKYLDGQPVVTYLMREKKYNSRTYNDNYETKHEIIFGEGFHLMTLYNCRWFGTEEIGKDLFKLKYKVQYTFFNHHIKSLDEPIIKSLTFIYPYISSWYDEWNVHDKIVLDNSSEFGIRAGIGTEKKQKIFISENLEFELIDTIERRMLEVGVSHSITYKKLVRFNYKSSVTFKVALKDALTFGNFLEFSFGERINYKLIDINVANKYVLKKNTNIPFETDDNFVYVGNYSLNKGEKVDKHQRHQHAMVLSINNCKKAELNAIVRKWFENKKLYNIYDFYLDSNYWAIKSKAFLSNVMFNNRFLNIIQGLEDYFRESINQQIDQQDFFANKKKIMNLIKERDLKKWFNDNFKPPKFNSLEQKLKIVLDELKPIFTKELFDNFFYQSFPAYATDMRNKLSHGKNKETYQGVKLHVYFLLGQVLLGICILKTLEVKDIPRKIKGHYEWNKSLNDVLSFKEN